MRTGTGRTKAKERGGGQAPPTNEIHKIAPLLRQAIIHRPNKRKVDLVPVSLLLRRKEQHANKGTPLEEHTEKELKN